MKEFACGLWSGMLSMLIIGIIMWHYYDVPETLEVCKTLMEIEIKELKAESARLDKELERSAI